MILDICSHFELQKKKNSNLKVLQTVTCHFDDLPGDHGPPCKKMREERPKKHSGKVQKGVCRSRKQDLTRLIFAESTATAAVSVLSTGAAVQLPNFLELHTAARTLL